MLEMPEMVSITPYWVRTYKNYPSLGVMLEMLEISGNFWKWLEMLGHSGV